MTTGLLTMTDDLLIHIASMLTAPTDLVRLQLTCPRFTDKVCGSSEMLSHPGGGGAAVGGGRAASRSAAGCRVVALRAGWA